MRIRPYYHIWVVPLLFHLDELLKGNFALLMHNEFALLNQSRRSMRTIVDVKNEIPQNILDWLYQIVQEEPKLVVEKWLDDLIVEEDPLWQP